MGYAKENILTIDVKRDGSLCRPIVTFGFMLPTI